MLVLFGGINWQGKSLTFKAPKMAYVVSRFTQIHCMQADFPVKAEQVVK